MPPTSGMGKVTRTSVEGLPIVPVARHVARRIAETGVSAYTCAEDAEHLAQGFELLDAENEQLREALKAEPGAIKVTRDLYEHVLRNIANGAWNAGRETELSVQEYARQTLGASVVSGVAR